MSFLKIDNLCKRFGSNTVLDGISFEVEKNEIMAVIGSSGVGKTTLLRCLNFLERADEGTICLNGDLLFDAVRDKEISDQEITQKRLHFGLVFQSFNLFPQYTALENVTLAATLLKKGSREELDDKAMALLSQVGLEDKADYYPYQLSGGQQQRVAIARALILDPEVLCFDEPTSALDPELSDNVARLIKSLKSDGKAIIVITHDMDFAKKVADRVTVLKDGNVLTICSKEEYFGSQNGFKI